MSIPHKCPVCDGTGWVVRPPGVAGDAPGWSSSNCGPYPCRACYGKGIIWEGLAVINVVDRPVKPGEMTGHNIQLDDSDAEVLKRTRDDDILDHGC